ncbi:Soyasaponin III rhamnosyltransferase [Bertholletia excelsa]
MLPLWTDQGLNAEAFDDEVGLEIRRDEEDGSFRREAVVETLKQVIVEEEGKTDRDKTKEMKAIVGDKERQDKYLHTFTDYLESLRRQHKDLFSAADMLL